MLGSEARQTWYQNHSILLPGGRCSAQLMCPTWVHQVLEVTGWAQGACLGERRGGSSHMGRALRLAAP